MDRYTDPLFGLLTMLVMWFLLGDVLDQGYDDFFSVIAFGAALIFTVVWVYGLIDTLSDSRRSRSGDDS